MYSSSSTKQIFEKLAHSSIMRLNKSSMDKLYDLMMMGFKRQIVSCSNPRQYLIVTLNHLESIKRLVTDTHVHDLVQVAIDSALSAYCPLNDSQWLTLKSTLLKFLQEKKVKVSLFLQQGMQTPDGVLVLTNAGKLPFATEMPGTIRYYESGTVVSTGAFEISSVHGCLESDGVVDFSNKLGMNMYSKENPWFVADAKDSGEVIESFVIANRAMNTEGSSRANSKPKGSSGFSSSSGGGSPFVAVSSSSAKAELSMLADLLGIDSGAGSKSDVDAKPFKINLFPDSGFDSKGGEGKDGDDESGYVIQIDIDATADAKSMERYMEDLDLNDDPKAASKGGDDDDDDLLALMDSAK